MKFGVRDICNVTFKAKNTMQIGNTIFRQGQPVLMIDTATASTLEQATTTVYAQGGRGNARLLAWDGEKTVTFTVTDALISPIGLSILSGAGLFKGGEDDDEKLVHIHKTASAQMVEGEINLSGALAGTEEIDKIAPVFVLTAEKDGSIIGKVIDVNVEDGGKSLKANTAEGEKAPSGYVFVDFYTTKKSTSVNEIQIDASSFGGNFYVEAETLFRNLDGVDMPAIITLPNVKIQSNFTFSMAATGDPSTFDFTMDALPDYTMFDHTKKVMCVIQIVDDAEEAAVTPIRPVMPHNWPYEIAENAFDSIEGNVGEEVAQDWTTNGVYTQSLINEDRDVEKKA